MSRVLGVGREIKKRVLPFHTSMTLNHPHIIWKLAFTPKPFDCAFP